MADNNIKELLDDLNNINMEEKFKENSTDKVVVTTNGKKDRGLADIQKNEETLPSDVFNDELSNNLQNDYRYAREKIISMLNRIDSVYDVAVEESLSSGDPKQISSIASLLKSVVDSSNKLLELSSKYEEPLLNVIPDEEDDGGQVNIQSNNYYYGSYENVVEDMSKENSLDNRFGKGDKKKKEDDK